MKRVLNIILLVLALALVFIVAGIKIASQPIPYQPKPATTATEREVRAVPALLWQTRAVGIVSAFTEREEQLIVPDRRPGISENVAGRHIIGLTGQNIAIGLDTNRIFPSIASFRTDFKLDR